MTARLTVIDPLDPQPDIDDPEPRPGGPPEPVTPLVPDPAPEPQPPAPPEPQPA